MNCSEIRNEIEQSIIGKSTLPVEVSEHIMGCADCHAYYESEQAFARMISDEFKALPIPTPQLEKLSAGRKPARLNRLVLALSGVAAVLLAAASIFYLLTGPAGDAQSLYAADGTSIIASPDSDLIINESGRQVILKESGKLHVTVSKDHGQPFQLITSAGTILVHGTEFSVSVKEEEVEPLKIKTSVLIYVAKGEVRLTTTMGDALGKDGETLYAEDSSAPLVCKN
ncbi:MAG: FecR domain-containing protein [Planctomycetes bacterium]|nr:FecR domain-containing protein [Planctomycetota bacterium]